MHGPRLAPVRVDDGRGDEAALLRRRQVAEAVEHGGVVDVEVVEAVRVADARRREETSGELERRAVCSTRDAKWSRRNPRAGTRPGRERWSTGTVLFGRNSYFFFSLFFLKIYYYSKYCRGHPALGLFFFAFAFELCKGRITPNTLQMSKKSAKIVPLRISSDLNPARTS